MNILPSRAYAVPENLHRQRRLPQAALAAPDRLTLSEACRLLKRRQAAVRSQIAARRLSRWRHDTAREAAYLLVTSRKTIRHLIKSGRLAGTLQDRGDFVEWEIRLENLERLGVERERSLGRIRRARGGAKSWGVTGHISSRA